MSEVWSFLAGMFGSRPVEIIAVVLGLFNVGLLMRRSIWNYPFGLAMVTLYAFIFFEAKLYSDMLLQGFFFALQVYGWWYWLKSPAARDGHIEVRLMDRRSYWTYGAAGVLGIGALGTFMARMTDAALPYPDATTTVLSVLAQILLARRRLENWILWIVVDVLAIGIYFIKGLYPTMVLYAVFLAMATGGFLMWRRVYRDQRGAPQSESQSERKAEPKAEVKRVCLYGPESTGKTTLARHLAAHFETVMMPEYGRLYEEERQPEVWLPEHFVEIAETHQAMQAELMEKANRVLIEDTDPLLTKIWSLAYLDAADPWFDQEIPLADLYLLTDIDVPWVDDGLRQLGAEEKRRAFFDAAKAELDARGARYLVLSGGWEARQDKAVAAVEALLNEAGER